MRAGDKPFSAVTVDGSARENAPADEGRVFAQPMRLGRFVLLQQIGTGGMGTVFSAYDERLDRKVALKLLSNAQPGGELPRANILREARAAARISHPNVIAIYEVDETKDQIYIAMEYVDGGTLFQWQERGGHSWQEVFAMYLQVGEGLAAAHAVQVVHRDFKPDNVLIGADGRPHVVDFGLARLGWSSSEDEINEAALSNHDLKSPPSGRLTLPGVISGTPGYMSPEQYRGGDVDSRSDQWSFCVALYEALYGHLPFSGDTLVEQARSIRKPPRPRPAHSLVPDDVHQALLRGMSFDPSQRFASMDDLLAMLWREQRGDAAAGGLSRKRISRALIIAAIFCFVVLQVRQLPRALTYRDTVATSLFMTSVLIVGGILQRRSLLASRFHRHVFILLFITITQNLLQRLVAARLQLPLEKLMPFELIVFAGTAATLAATLIPWMWFVPLIPLGAAVASLMHWLPQRLLSLAYIACLVLFVIGWSRTANRVGKGAEGSYDGLGAASGRRTTSSGSGRRSSSKRTKQSNPNKRTGG